jgi:hypothetical protein
VTGSFRGTYWRFLGQTLLRAPKRLTRAVAMAIGGEHMIRYTREAVLPRLAEAIEEARAAEVAAGAKAMHARPCRERIAPAPHVSPAPASF